MFDEKKLWKERASLRLKELGRYLRYIFNGHLMIVLIFFVGAAAYYYQQWLITVTPSFPAQSVMAIFFALLLTYSPVYHFLLEADKVFLIPLETRLKGYFLNSGIVSFVYQGYLLLLALAAFMPLYARVSGQGFRSFLLFLIVLLLLKIWNLNVGWRAQYEVETSVHRWDLFVRFCMNGSFIYFIFKQANMFFPTAIFLIMAVYYAYFHTRSVKKGLKWDALISQEEKRMASFYRIANLFTDVPKIKDTVKRRRVLDIFLKGISYSPDKTFDHLFSRAFLRSGDYFGLYLRLTVIGGVALYFLTFGLGQILLAVLFIYLTGFQLLPLWNHHQNKLWVDLYPLRDNVKTRAFTLLLSTLLTIQGFIFAALVFIKGDVTAALLALLAGIAFIYLFVHFYSRKRLGDK
ncbi:MAG: ABC transporter permease [Bacillota bacterium]|nr:ABC transporter permease [Bacillota bacterium]